MVLVVDDQPLLRLLAVGMVEDAGFEPWRRRRRPEVPVDLVERTGRCFGESANQPMPQMRSSTPNYRPYGRRVRGGAPLSASGPALIHIHFQWIFWPSCMLAAAAMRTVGFQAQGPALYCGAASANLKAPAQ